MCYEGLGCSGSGGLLVFLSLGALIGFITWAVIRFSRRDGSESKANHVDIAKERYAKGEISKEEFEQIKKDLS